MICNLCKDLLSCIIKGKESFFFELKLSKMIDEYYRKMILRLSIVVEDCFWTIVDLMIFSLLCLAPAKLQ